ncbi:hypothetical protein DICVIV_04116 [Dictyocaulus viviparus]|uniref:FHA domain-containing protein n=1 Tax=Dictyocaulus viviparus TaxID=29172 RepID=A0A0D8Y5E4_DICVI|nr:hypothetical protein DICVIV_04116 [Dictyocaulus viviparus]
MHKVSPEFMDEVTFCDTSTYGTVVDGKLVKSGSHIIKGDAHIFVGDVELIVIFPKHQLGSSTGSCGVSSTPMTCSSSKRKGNASESVGSETKRSRFCMKKDIDSAKQHQISSLFVEKPCIEVDSDEEFVLADDTPQSPIKVFAPETQQEKIQSSLSSKYSDSKTDKSNRDITNVMETCERSMQPSPCAAALYTSSNQVMEMSEGRISPPYTTSVNKRISSFQIHTSNLQPLAKRLQTAGSTVNKKSRVFDCDPTFVNSSAENREKSVASHKEVDSTMDLPNVANMLKLVSTGKYYDDIDDDINIVQEKGLEIKRVVAKLSDLVRYVDIECRPPRTDTITLSRNTSSDKCNFKRFKKASQGRFNTSVTSASTHHIIDGNNDLVDFRKISHL